MSDLAARGAMPSTLAPRAGLPLPAPQGPAFRPEVAARHYPELAGYLEELELAMHEGRTPDTADALHLPELIEGLNLADRALRLERHLFVLGSAAPAVLQSSLAQRLGDSLGTGQAWRGVLTDGDHGTAISLRFSGSSNDVSMLLVDSSAWSPRDVDHKRRTWQATLAMLAPALQERAGPQARPVRLHLGMLATDVQRTRAILGPGERGQGRGGRAAALRGGQGANLADEVIPVLAGHPDVADDHVRPFRHDQLQRLLRRGGGDDRRAALLQ